MSKTTETAEVVIVGGGVIGASVAYHLAVRGCREVLVLEREPELGRGSTGRATGGFRAQFASEIDVRLSLLAREKLLRFRDEVGADSGYRPCGYLFLAEAPARLAALRALAPFHRPAGLPQVEDVAAEDLRRLNPAVRRDGIAGGTFCPLSGFLRPLDLLAGYARAARRLGARCATDVEVVGFAVEQRGGERRVTAVETSRGRIAARCVVNAAGPWAGVVARLAAIELPVSPLRRQVAFTEPFAELPEDMPMTVFLDDGFHLRVRDGRVLLLWPAETSSEPSAGPVWPPGSGDPFDTRFAATWLPGVLARAHARLPCLARAAIDLPACWAGLYEMSPDRHAIVGPAPGCANFYLANGSSGHGIMHAPALGQLLAEMILDGAAHTLDLHPLRPTRFAEGQPITDPDLL
ncbi:MAG TPA: FAD-binding oxidoreductase [Thermoanaerobaculia bacterium]|nr:FAD-binding oxidoreductase [Thermoanaerobaculia bacterium]